MLDENVGDNAGEWELNEAGCTMLMLMPYI